MHNNYNNYDLKSDGIYIEYLRKSRADLELEKLKKHDTLNQHDKFLKDLAKKLNINIKKVYKEVVSGESIQERTEMQKLLKEVETGLIDGVLVVEIERLTRGDSKDQGIVAQTFKYSNTKIITLNKIYDPNSQEDEEYFEFGLFMSRREYKTINRRMQRGRIANVLEGKYCASLPPFGYNKIHIKNGKGFTLEPKKDEAEIVKEIFEKAKNGIGINIICNWLNTLEFKPRKSDVWTSSTIRDMLNNPIYIGKIRWNYSQQKKNLIDGKIIKKRIKSKKEDLILVEGLHQPIITEELFNSKTKNDVKRVSTKHSLETKNSLSGIVKCKYCGRTMQRRPYYKTNKTKLKRKYKLDKEKLRLLLREHKGNYSLNDISKKLNIPKYTVDHWFSTSIEKFCIPHADIWFKLKKLLSIDTDEFDKAITIFEEKEQEVHEDTLICPKPHCINVSSNLSIIEKYIIMGIKTYINKNEKVLTNYNPNIENTKNLKYISLLNELNKNKKQLDKAYELVEKEIYTPIEFSQRTSVIKTRIMSIEKELEKEEIVQKPEKIKSLLPKMEKVLDTYYSIESVEDKNRLLKSIISYVDYSKDKGGKGFENNFKLTIHPKI